MPPQDTPKPDNSSTELKPLRTYQSDVEEVLKKENVSLSKIALAEEVKRAAPALFTVQAPKPKVLRVNTAPANAAQSVNWKRLGVLLLSGTGLGLLIWGAFNFATRPRAQKPETSPVTIEEEPKTPPGAVALQSSFSKTATIKALRERIKSAGLPLNGLATFAVTLNGFPIDAGELFALLRANAEGELVRALGVPVTFGAHNFKGNQLFIVFPVLSFDHAFDGMLAFEKTLLLAIGPLFGIEEKAVVAPSGTTTAELLEKKIVWKDVIIKNKDARAAFTRDGSIAFLYGFRDKQTLILTTNDETFKLLLNRTGDGMLK